MTKQIVRVCGPKDKPKGGITDHIQVLNVTSGGNTWVKHFSPMLLGPCKLYGTFESQTMENGWQFSKVYSKHTDDRGNPTDAYWKWAKQGWADSWAHRYPAGKGSIPAYCLWDGMKLGYIDARIVVYEPLYAKAVLNSGLFESLCDYVNDSREHGIQIYLFDYDGYDNEAKGMTLEDVKMNSKLKMGHAFMLADMIQEVLK